ncbi:hypothetical protein LTR16_012779, partial [Cryomyces antarcticus]
MYRNVAQLQHPQRHADGKTQVCPPGTKMYLLEVGWLECDEGFVIRGGNTSLKSTEGRNFVNKRRELPMYC